MVRAWALAAIACLSCSVDLGIEGMKFRCDSTSQCASGFHCALGICSRAGDGGAPDSGTESCGFDEEFDLTELDDWQHNGDAAPFPGFVRLTSANSNQRGTLWHRRRIRAERFSYQVEFNIIGGVPGDGMAVAWIEEEPSASGGSSANLGAYGLNGYLVELDTFGNTGLGDPPSEHIAWARTRGMHLPELDPSDRLATVNVASLRSAETRSLRIEFDRGSIQIFLDEGLVLTASTASYQPFDATFGATAATGAQSDSHTVHRLTLRCL